MALSPDTASMASDTLSQPAATPAPKKEKVEIVALKNNLAYDAIATPNLQLEFRLTPKWSIEFGVGLNPFPLKDETFPKWRHLSVSVAPRYWFCNVFNRGFISFNAAYVHYNVAGNSYPIGWMYPQVKDSRYQGDAVMAGVSYGWHFPISPHFSIELEAGADAGYSWFSQFECKHCGGKTNQGGRWLVLPKIGINLSVPLPADDVSLARRCDCELLDEKPEESSAPADTALAAAPAETAAPAQTAHTATAPMDSMLVSPVEPVATTAVASVVPHTDVPATATPAPRKRHPMLCIDDAYEPYDRSQALGEDNRNMFMYFDVYITEMDRSFIHNAHLMDSVLTVIGEALADSTMRITRMRIIGYASFDGPQALNERLALERAATIRSCIQAEYHLPDSLFTLASGGESWAELRYNLMQENFEGRDEIVRIIDEEPDLDQRERKIKRLHHGETYRYLKTHLRHIMRRLGCITIYYENVK